ncbi:MAG TPA: hypothetical protein ENH14_00830 [candidate division WOR-3 bacterium]|uniref:Bacterial surface antigen (D15) domain-containing protein n=1 Tax=candidate division WOR-3 bacterium TaxID=2052148 RepID=A0A7V0Q659_UNCW3|nr:hypothetical protein [candidate division WOR-3 bacterium]
MTKKIFFLFFLLLTTPYILDAYYFGKNKIQTRSYDFKIVESQHFRIFFYSGGEELFKFAVPVLEEAYEEYKSVFGIDFDNKIPVIIYNSPKHFQETNVIPQLIEEGVGGFTEIFKSRVVVPFTGSYREFRHVLRHELVHVFQYRIIMGKLRSSLITATVFRIPLWVMEGMAEYLSLGWSRDAESYIRDLAINNKLPSVEELGYYGGYIVYKEGQLIYKYVAENYGEEKVGEFFNILVFRRSLDEAIKKCFGITLEEFDKRFEEYVKKNYYPLFKEFDSPSGLKEITFHNKDASYMNVAPALSSDGSRVAFITDRSGRTNIVLYSAVSGRKLKTLVKGAKTPDFENLHMLRPGVNFSVDAKRIVFSAQSGSGDRIYIVNTENGRVEKSIKLDVDAIYTPVFSPSGKFIAFVGIKNSRSDIYIYDLESDTTIQLTNDPFDDRDPYFTDDGENVLFVSDRVLRHKNDTVFIFGSYAIFKINLKDRSIERLTPYARELKNPRLIQDTLLYFIRDYRGALNVFEYNIKTEKLYIVTRFISEVKDFDIAPKTNRMALSILWDGGYDIYIYSLTDTKEVKSIQWDESPPMLVKISLLESQKKYSPSFSLDWVNGYAEYMYPYGFSGLMALGLSDELGDHEITVITDLYQDILNSQFEITYSYLPRRTDYIFSIYQYWDFYYISDFEAYLNKNLGVEALLSYPLSRFRRFEFGLNFENQERHFLVEDIFGNFYEIPSLRETKNFLGVYLAHVFDNVLYSYYSDPLDGTRYYIGATKSVFLSTDLTIGVLDFRHYIRLAKRYVWANRFTAKYSTGRDSIVFTMGGPYDLRGYEYGELMGNKSILFSSELRVPFIDKIKIAFPLPLEIGGIRGVVFLDVGNAWSGGMKLQPFDKFPRLKDLKGDVGAGIRLELGFAKLKIDWAKKTNFVSVYDHTWQISLGRDF